MRRDEGLLTQLLGEYYYRKKNWQETQVCRYVLAEAVSIIIRGTLLIVGYIRHLYEQRMANGGLPQ